ncbi:GNAT family N-acetyltransferase [Deinococcus sp. Arct2-2]|uniref:GNAT family N-acetyltransferase n=1 Tax=Deinococcus sp. Arct2-2 TaxID=2568653 RepID=UPI0010A3255B|nr:GNAT family N-acetyltransferase [Deinococcus sp. Arct2-2]THF71925.1 GNAT family N-acetyltransferase [Deinococcus sp. Arct2-2]
MTPLIRPFNSADTTMCLALFDSNIPTFFTVQERADFEAYLLSPGAYWVVEQAGELVACGGVWQNFGRPERRAGLAWGMVRRDLHRSGFGSLLLRHRLSALRDMGELQCWIDTSQHSAPFFARHGFQETKRTPDGYGPGLDEVVMVRELDVESTKGV